MDETTVRQIAHEAIEATRGRTDWEQAAVAHLYQSGEMAGRTCGEQVEIESEVRQQLLDMDE